MYCLGPEPVPFRLLPALACRNDPKGRFTRIWKETNVLNDQTEIIDHEIHSQIIDKTAMRSRSMRISTVGKNIFLKWPRRMRSRSGACAGRCARALCWNHSHCRRSCAACSIISGSCRSNDASFKCSPKIWQAYLPGIFREAEL